MSDAGSVGGTERPTQAVTAAYEAAAAAKPTDPALQDALFGAYVRERQLVKQQQVRCQ